MKKCIAFVLAIVFLFCLCGCSDTSFGHEIYTEINDYGKIFELSEIRFKDDAFELYPKSVDNLNVTDFYFEWSLGIVGSATAEMILSVEYSKEGFYNEIDRIKNIDDGKIVCDTENFIHPAYVSILGYKNTNYYSLVDEENLQIHYILLQIINIEDIDINKDFLPKGYDEFGAVKDISYNIYE